MAAPRRGVAHWCCGARHGTRAGRRAGGDDGELTEGLGVGGGALKNSCTMVVLSLNRPRQATPDPLLVLALLEDEQKYQNAHKTVENMSRIKRWKPLVKVARSADQGAGRQTH
ncbi:hypothetical protein U9M48_008929 [Paspalum notatum var. saurae]|uniref:Uncharacterized protein n=1 Tax=Paspalum notatum var. saurae TaxID=547442 RepID=A0AAQ3SQB7_PASNO